ncbi:MAG: CpaF family protein, partial [Bauldia sp.]
MFGKRGTTGSGGTTPPPGKAPAPPAASAPRAAPPPVPRPAASATPAVEPASAKSAAPEASKTQRAPPSRPAAPSEVGVRRSENFYDVKSIIFSALIDTIDLAQLARLDLESAREEIRDIVNDIIALKNIVMSIAEQEDLLEDICNDVLGLGPLEPLLARDDIADIMVNGAHKTYIEVAGRVQQTAVRFRDNTQLMNICQRIVSQVGRRVD